MSANDELQDHTCEKMLEFYGNVAKNVANEKVQDYVKKSHNVTENEQKSEKTTQDVQKNCLSLTELKDGAFYYTINGIEEAHFCEVNGVPELVMPELEEVLAPVPSYEEYSRLEWYAGCGPDRIVELNKENRQLRKWCEEFNTLDVAKENAKLKELLKECREVAEFTKTIVNKHKWFNEVITKIDEVLK